jgi:eukaryotic-like serine/threonine-protein kinase
VLYEALSGTSAYPEMPTYEQTIIKIVLERPKPLSEIAPWVPAEVAAVVHAALTHELDKRTADCGTFARQLVQTRAATDGGDALRGRTSTPQHVIRPPSDGSVKAVDTHSSTMQGPAVPTPAKAHVASTSTGVTLDPKESAPGLPKSRLGAGLALLGILSLLLIAGLALGVKRHLAGGDVVTAATQGLAASATTPTTVIPDIPSASASAPAPVMSAPSSSSSGASVAPAIAPVHRPPVGAPKTPAKPEASTSAAPAPKTQFGAAGVSTAY